jgi:hypothetical protein
MFFMTLSHAGGYRVPAVGGTVALRNTLSGRTPSGWSSGTRILDGEKFHDRAAGITARHGHLPQAQRRGELCD